jgi:hypothetical protein
MTLSVLFDAYPAYAKAYGALTLRVFGQVAHEGRGAAGFDAFGFTVPK